VRADVVAWPLPRAPDQIKHARHVYTPSRHDKNPRLDAYSSVAISGQRRRRILLLTSLPSPDPGIRALAARARAPAGAPARRGAWPGKEPAVHGRC
jgi:hypothetical protein